MTPLGIAGSLLSLLGTDSSANTRRAGLDAVETANDFSSSLTLRLAELQAQSFNSLAGSIFGGQSATSSFDFLTSTTGLPNLTNDTNGLPGLSASGRQLSLFDPESAYRMMTVINNSEVTYKAQFAELSEMTAAVGKLQQAGNTLGEIDANTAPDTIKTQLQAFIGQYNEWIQRFDGTVKSDGLLAGTQAAEVSLRGLEQSIENIFNGASDGFHGMRDVGLVIDQNTNLASLDTARLDAALASNPQGVINTIDQFSANFARSAELLVSTNNFLPNRLANLDRVIDYISENTPALQAEFGLGDPARPSAKASQALAAYQRMTSL